MAKKKAAPAPIEPEEESQELPEEEPARVLETAPPSDTMSKADACRAALAAGIDTAEKAQEFTRSKFGVEIKPTDFALYKSKGKKAEPPTAKGKPGRKPKAAPSPAIEGYLAPPPAPNPPGEQLDLLAAMEAMKPLVAALGVEKVKRIADLLG